MIGPFRMIEYLVVVCLRMRIACQLWHNMNCICRSAGAARPTDALIVRKI
jgi:hypothetical protein